MCSTDIFLGLLAILFPPLPVWVKCGICSADSIINILLCMLGFLPGLLHAWYIIAKFPEPAYDYAGPRDQESGHVYVFVHEDGRRTQHQHPVANKPQQHHGMSYGTTTNNTAGSSSAPAQGQGVPAPVQPIPQQGPNDNGEGPSDGPPPPSYAQVVAGDHKVQSNE
ncbi:UPF0057-domain-containing protein [Diplogelasinospora grovesii]|uniref:UPF0057-domain-containing protein n=1 Tax=Diplogelasinospora grovesii TaxID=303347 RepID=A0AAN6N6Y8_9PEZI|nr:UPF0057-domain-containing protein [Diplogelasinospora grovesii]